LSYFHLPIATPSDYALTAMIVFLNDRFVPEEQAVVSAFDRAFLYGDGLFETLRTRGSALLFWERHIQRLEQGAHFLNIQLPLSPEHLLATAKELLARNGIPEALLRLTLSRGSGGKGFSPIGAQNPFITMSLRPVPPLSLDAPAPWKLATSSIRLPSNDPLTRFKTCNKLHQVLAKAQAEASRANDALMLNSQGHAVETSSANLFWIEGNTLCTPPLSAGPLPGITRAFILEQCAVQGIATQESLISPEALLQTQGVFLSLTSLGTVDVSSLDYHPLPKSPVADSIRNSLMGKYLQG
jgi:aminodeoxychorismate lyase